jgi:hypothetical protein
MHGCVAALFSTKDLAQAFWRAALAHVIIRYRKDSILSALNQESDFIRRHAALKQLAQAGGQEGQAVAQMLRLPYYSPERIAAAEKNLTWAKEQLAVLNGWVEVYNLAMGHPGLASRAFYFQRLFKEIVAGCAGQDAAPSRLEIIKAE